MVTRKRIPRTSDAAAQTFTRAGDGPGDFIYDDLPPKKRQALLDEARQQRDAAEKEAAAKPRSLDAADTIKQHLGIPRAPAIRNGVKTERDTQPVQVRMLKAQLKVLKQIASQENRTTSDIIRDLVDAYVWKCYTEWQDGSDAKTILTTTMRQAGYFMAVAEDRHGPGVHKPMTPFAQEELDNN